MKKNCLLLLSFFASVLTVYATTINHVEIIEDSSFTAQLRYSNTYYVIKDVIDLEGASVIIPKDCVLKMEGGQLKNGIIIGNNTYIEASPYSIFSSNLNLKGTFIASEAYPEWFESTDDAVKIRKSLEIFDNVKLTAKHYILQSVDENGYGIVVPSGRILHGNRRANNTLDNDQIIEIKGSISYKAVVALSSSTILTDLTIQGQRKNNTSCVATLGGFQSRLTIERVGTSGAHYGFNLQTYLTNINQCVANYNDVGFYIHGEYSGNDISIEGTTISVSTCFAVDSKITGYEMVGIAYSTMNNCAADGCGAPVSGNLSNNVDIGYAYSFTQCKNLTINSCGVENGLAAVKTQTCKNIIFNSPSFLINKRTDVKVSNEFVMGPVVNIRYSSFIEFNYMFLHSDGMSKYYTDNTPLMLLYGSAQSSPSVIMKNGYEGIKESNIGTEGFLTKEKNLIIE